MTATFVDFDGTTLTSTREITIDKYGTANLVTCVDHPFDPDQPTLDFSTDLTAVPTCSLDVPSVAEALSECTTTNTNGPDGCSGTEVESGVTTISVSSSRSDTSYSFSIDHRSIESPDLVQHYEGSITLSDPYTTNDVYADAVFLASLWSLIDDLRYPFRQDVNMTQAPLVIRNELPPQSPAQWPPCQVDDYTNPIDDADGNHPFAAGWSPTWGQRAWFDPNSFQWKYSPPANSTEVANEVLIQTIDGAIIGAPLDPGYGQAVGGNPYGVFDKDHENFFRRNCDIVGWTQATESRGAFTPGYLPSNAQKWTDDFEATHLWPCAFVNADDTGVYLQKWCEVKLQRPSANFARPFGPDKFALEETQVYYVVDFTGGIVTLQNTDFTTPSSLPFIVGDIVGSAAAGGFFAVSSVGTDTVTLGALVRALPTGWDTPSHDGGFCFGKLKYPNAPGMDFIDPALEVGGRVSVTVTNGTSITITTGTVQKYLSLTSAENVDILAADNTVLASNVAATRVDDTHFTVPTAFATIATAKWIVPHLLNDGVTSGQKYKFADSRSKGDYVFRTWLIRIADETLLATSQQDACVQFNPCGPPVAGITPNGEAAFQPFPATINNGEVWLGQIQFWMDDPFWQKPHTPVDVGDPDFNRGVDQVIWSEDNGSCQEDFTEVGGGGETIYHKFYPMRPFVEARCTLPTNVDGETAPALASGTDLTAVATAPGQATIGNITGPLVAAIELPTPTWGKMLQQRGCVATNSRFATDYAANGTTP